MEYKLIKEYWEAFLIQGQNREIYADKEYEAWHFCDNKEDADELAELVLSGTKNGTASHLNAYKKDGEPLPQTGEISIIINWSGSPRCIIETIKIDRYPFTEVPSSFAATEGEGDGSLEYWRQAHLSAFSREAAELDIEFNDKSIVLCEEFRVIYPTPDGVTVKKDSL
jgi:uncharacterized protein YhfF